MAIKVNHKTICRKARSKQKAATKKEYRQRANLTLMIRKPIMDFRKKRGKASSHESSISCISDFKTILQSANPTEQEVIEAIEKVRSLCSTPPTPYIDNMINAGIVPLLVDILDCGIRRNSGLIKSKEECSRLVDKGGNKCKAASNTCTKGFTVQEDKLRKLIYVTAWALTNIALTSANHVANSGAIKPLIQLLSHNDVKIKEQSAWCLGNIAGEGSILRDQVLDGSAIEPLLTNLADPKNTSHLGIIVFAISNLCKGNPTSLAPFRTKIFHNLVFVLLDKSTVEELATDVVWALSYLSNEDEQHTELPISPCFLRKLMSKLIELLEINFKCKKPIIQIIGNAVSGSDSQTQIVLDSGFLNHLADLLGNSSTEVRKNSCGIIAMIACGNHDQIQQLMKRKKILHQLVVKATHDQWSVRKEALWAIVYILTNGSYTDISWMIGANGFDPLITFLALENSDVKLLVAVLDAVENAFKAHQKYLDLFAENRGIDYIEELQKHRSDVVYKKVVYLIDNFFGVEEDENSIPATNDSGHFTLGMTSVPTPKNLFPIKQNQGSPKESSSPFRHLFTNNRSSH